MISASVGVLNHISYLVLYVIFVTCPQTVMAAGHLGAELEEAGAWSAYAVDRRYP